MSTSDTRSAIEANDRIFEANYNSGNTEGVAALYTDDGQVLPAHSDVVAGKEAISALFQAFRGMGVDSVALETVEVEDYGEAAMETGRYTLKDANGQVLDTGKFIVIWKKVGAEWKMYRDMFNSSVPSPE